MKLKNAKEIQRYVNGKWSHRMADRFLKETEKNREYK